MVREDVKGLCAQLQKRLQGLVCRLFSVVNEKKERL